MMKLLRVPAGLMCLVLSVAASAEFPALLIDYTRLVAPFGVRDLPQDLVKRVPGPHQPLALQWVAIDVNDAVKVRLVEVNLHDTTGEGVRMLRSFTLEFETLDEYRRVVADHAWLYISTEAPSVLRDRRREVGLDSHLEPTGEQGAKDPRILQNKEFLTHLPPDFEWNTFQMRGLESLIDGRVSLRVSAVAEEQFFTRTVDFDSLDAFNRVSGENVRPEEFARLTLPFWIVPDRLSGIEPPPRRMVMKTRAEIAQQCGELLAHGIRVSAEAP